MFCPRCGLRAPSDHRFCASCGAALPRQHLKRRGPKLSRWFWAIPISREDPADCALRVSRYLAEYEISTAEGSVLIPSDHVRFSIWVDDRAVAALSLPESEAESLAEFLLARVSNGNGLEPVPLA